MNNQNKQTMNGLPYTNTWQSILITLVINLIVTLILYLLNIINKSTFVTDAFFCGFISTLVSVAVAYPQMKRLRMSGALPSVVEEGHILQKLPRNPILLSLALGVLFALLMGVFAFLVRWFFEIEDITPLRFLVWKLVYATILSIKMTELVVLRLVQPDCSLPGEPKQIGTAIVRNPLPRKDTFSDLLRTITDDFGFNLLSGLIFGSTVVKGHTVTISPTTRDGIIIGGIVLGMILTLRMVYPVAKSIYAQQNAGVLPRMDKSTFLSKLPYRPGLFALILLVPVMLLSAGTLWCVLTFFGFTELSFFQFYIIRSIYVSLLLKVVILIAVRRYSQPSEGHQ